MTRDEILAMEPGFREMIDAVTYQIIGWKRSESWGGMNWVGEDGSYKADFATWDPTTDIAAAWEVVEKMRTINWWIVLNSEGEKWTALFYWDPHQQACEHEADTAPEAICKAALLAVMDV